VLFPNSSLQAYKQGEGILKCSLCGMNIHLNSLWKLSLRNNQSKNHFGGKRTIKIQSIKFKLYTTESRFQITVKAESKTAFKETICQSANKKNFHVVYVLTASAKHEDITKTRGAKEQKCEHIL
jgi:hypothetical protein